MDDGRRRITDYYYYLWLIYFQEFYSEREPRVYAIVQLNYTEYRLKALLQRLQFQHDAL